MDITELIRKQLGNVTQLEDRVMLKGILDGVFMELYEQNSQMYHQLEERVFGEIEYKESTYTVWTGVVKKSEYDLSHTYMFPMNLKDISEEKYDLNEMTKAAKEGKLQFIKRVFFRCDYLIFKNMMLDKQPFPGRIVTNVREYNGTFKAELTSEYWDIVSELYKNFIKNGIPWRTINVPYITRMVDIYLESTQEEIGKGEEIKEIIVDFGDNNQYAQYDVIPVWNIREVELKGTGFPLPCDESLNYEHAIPLLEHLKYNGYIVQINDNSGIKYIRRSKGKMGVVTGKDVTGEWKAYMIAQKDENRIERYDYPLMSNERQESFAGKMVAQSGGSIKTKAELMRFVESLNLTAYVEFVDAAILNKDENDREETYEMNSFIIDEIRDSAYSKRLVMNFKRVDESSFLIRDVLSFIVSEVQMIYGEYHCEGKII